ncbi:hypothetical protein C2S52_000310 [Perilla frutescens var. hirtella]|nr:hypothetical protein C2S52_000310 [Perilla frutescens var. hirtella]
MAVDAVASVVLQKLRDLLVDESFASNQIIGHRLRRVQEALDKTRGSLDKAADKETDAEAIKKLRGEYLRHVYSMEDSIESFALRFTRRRKRLGFLMNHALFLNKFTALQMLSSKLNSIQTKVKELDRRTSNLRGTPQKLQSENANDHEPDGVKGVAEGEDGGLDEEKEEDDGLDKEREEEEDDGLDKEREEEDDGLDKEREEEDAGRGAAAEKEVKKQSSFSLINEETDGLRSSMKRTKSSPTARTTQEKPPNIRWNNSCKCKVLLRSNDSTIQERVRHSKLMYSYSYNEEELSIVGYQRKVTELRKRLENNEDWIIPLVGELGSGKTTMARAVYGNRAIKEMFMPAAWASIFKESKTTDILIGLLTKKTELQDASSEESLKSKLKQELTGQRYLIVLDGVQTSDQWRRLKGAFPDQQNGSKIILTTRDERVEKHADRKIQPYNLTALDSEESWTLFMRKAGLKEEDPLHSDLKNRVIDVCQGLPLNIVLLGSLLSMKDREKWSKILNIHEKWQVSDTLTLSYNDLDTPLKLCLTYMTMFPKELDIPVRRLQRLWLAEGFVERPQKQEEIPEDVGQMYFENLVKRSLILVSKQRSDGSARRCRLQGALHDLLLKQAQDICLFHVHPESNPQECGSLGPRRLIEYADAGNCPVQASQIQHVRSYISFNLQKKDTPAKHVSSLLSDMVGKGLGLLRVLDLEGVYRPSLPENLGDLSHLRYLGLRWTFLDNLPKSVGELLYLETLDLKHTCLDKIPAAVLKLKNLRHLNLDEVHLDKDTVLHLCRSLPKLLTLWGLSVSHESPIKNGLSKLKNLRELGISFRVINGSNNTAEPTKALVEWISELTALQSLRLRSKDDCGHPADLSLKPFSKLTQLSHMKLLGKLQELPPIEHFPPHIKVLTLSLSCLSEDPMPTLGQLPDLTVLRLLGDSYTGETLVCKSGTFKNLEVLKLWKLKNLKKLEVEYGAMEKLKEVNIRCCSNLKNFPHSLLQQKTFKELILNNMPTAFKAEIDNNYQFKVSTKDFKNIRVMNGIVVEGEKKGWPEKEETVAGGKEGDVGGERVAAEEGVKI